MARVAGKSAIVTGAGSGIGRACAVMLAAEGAAVLCADINGDNATQTARRVVEAGGQAVARTVDVRDEDAVAAMVEVAITEFGRLDVLHNNAGGVDRERMLNDRTVIGMSEAFWLDSFAVNVNGPFFACKHALPHMIEQGGGSIINTASVSGLAGESTRPAYGAAKAALISLTRTIATTHGKQGIRANSIAPGSILGEGGQATASPELLDLWEQSTLLPRLGRTEDIAAMVVFLASDESSFVTGQTLVVDGGMLAHVPFYAQENEMRARRRALRQSADEAAGPHAT